MDASQPAHIEALHSHRAAATERSAQVRGARSQLKRGLKSGRVELASALQDPCAQDLRVLELLGYALVWSTSHQWSSAAAPQQVGYRALEIASAVQVGHFTLVSALSDARRAQLCEAVGQSPYAATVAAPLRAAS